MVRAARCFDPHTAEPGDYLDTRHTESHRLEAALSQPQRPGKLHLPHVAHGLAQEDEALMGRMCEQGWERGRRHGPGGHPLTLWGSLEVKLLHSRK